MHVGLQRGDAADDGSLRLATERVLQDASQFAVSEVDEVVELRHLLALRELVDDVREGQQ